ALSIYSASQKTPHWAGPGKGVMTLPAEQWHPYSPATFVSPPFPGYVSRHSTVSGACARRIELLVPASTLARGARECRGAVRQGDDVRDGRAAHRRRAHRARRAARGDAVTGWTAGGRWP